MGGWLERLARAPGERKRSGVAAPWARALYVLIVALALVLFQRGASRHATAVNRTAGKDQGSYLLLGKRIAQRKAMSLDGARPPAYPALLALLEHGGISKEHRFERARSVTIVWTLVAWRFPLLVGGSLVLQAPTIIHWVRTLGMAGW